MGVYEDWITALRVSWMGTKGKAIMGGFAAALGDRMLTWAQQANYEHMPQKAGSVASLALLGNERQLPQGSTEANSEYADRLIPFRTIHKLRGTPLGLLLALHWAGFDGAVIVQQNGLAHQLTLPLPTPGPDWDPKPNHVKSDCSTLAVALTSSVNPPTASSAGRSIPAGTPWWTFDSDTDHCSRFAVLFPAGLAVIGVATFDDTDSATVTWNRPFDDTSYLTLSGPPMASAGSDAPAVAVSSKTTTGATVVTSAPWTGTVSVLAWASGDNPFASVSGSNLARMQNAIGTWRPAKALCVGVYAIVQDGSWGWPITTWGDGSEWGPSEIISISGSF